MVVTIGPWRSIPTVPQSCDHNPVLGNWLILTTGCRALRSRDHNLRFSLQLSGKIASHWGKSPPSAQPPPASLHLHSASNSCTLTGPPQPLLHLPNNFTQSYLHQLEPYCTPVILSLNLTISLSQPQIPSCIPPPLSSSHLPSTYFKIPSGFPAVLFVRSQQEIVLSNNGNWGRRVCNCKECSRALWPHWLGMEIPVPITIASRELPIHEFNQSKKLSCMSESKLYVFVKIVSCISFHNSVSPIL